MLDLDVEVFACTALIYKLVGIGKDDISREIALSLLDIILILLQVIVIESNILCLHIVIILIQPY